jgi:hypothetical protein
VAKIKAESSVIIAVLFTISGIALIYFSTISSSEILALIGLGLLFWGATFFLITPNGFVDARLLLSTVYSEYSTFDRIIDNFDCKKCYYIPSILNQAIAYGGLRKMKDPVLFLSSEPNSGVMEDETFFIQKKFLLSKRNRGIVLTPPGLGLTKLFEKKNKNFYNMGLEKMSEVLPHLIAQDFGLTKDLIINIQSERIDVIIQKSLYKGLYNIDKGSNSAKIFGCPIVSAIGCILAQTFGKIVTIEEIKTSKDMSTLEALYRIVN